MKFTLEDFSYLGVYLEGFWCGVYSAIFAMYLQHCASKDDTGKMKNRVLLYALCILYVLSLSMLLFDMIRFLTGPIQRVYNFDSGGTIFGFCDFISQSILIYRCWIVWGRNIHVVIVPFILAIIFLATWLTAIFGASYISSGQIISVLDWGTTMAQTSLAISMIVNALVMGLIVFKIFKVFRKVKTTLGEQKFSITGGTKIRSMIFILIESSMALFSIQLARLVVVILCSVPGGPPDVIYKIYELITPIHQVVTGITPTIILVRVSMGLSFHDEASMVEVTSTLCFATPNDLRNPVPETGSISIVRQESKDEIIDI